MDFVYFEQSWMALNLQGCQKDFKKKENLRN